MTGAGDGMLKELQAAIAAAGDLAYAWDIRSDRMTLFGDSGRLFAPDEAAGIVTGAAYSGRINPEDLPPRLEALARHFRQDDPYDVEYRVRLADGSQRWVHDCGTAERADDGEPSVLRGVLRLINGQRQNEAELKHLANHDELTGHFNRSRLREALDQSIKYAKRYGISGAYLTIGVDKLTLVNAAFGHEYADSVLTTFSQRLEETIRASDAIGRLGGDRFGVVLVNCPENEVARAAEKILELARETVVETPFGAIHVTVSIGAVDFPGTAETAGEIMTKADIALEKAKRSGRDCFVIYTHSEEQRRGYRHSMVMAEQVKRALAENRLNFAYQPIIDTKTLRPAFYECLMRMTGSDGEVVPAAAFMPAVEQLGLIRVVDKRGLDLAIETLESDPDVRLAINVSGLTATEGSWLRALVSRLRGRPDIATRLTVEITETAALDDVDECARFVLSLRDFGCRVALDDFGAGYTSFGQVKTLSVDLIKIDGSFVRGLKENPENLVFIRTLIRLAENLGLETVAECVETWDEAEMLIAEGVDYLQGYAFGRPAAVRHSIEPPATLARKSA